MNFALTYLLGRLFYRTSEFFRHWYADGSRWFAHALLGALERLDQTFAVRITLRHFFKPLYQDYTLVGRILGPLFRVGRICSGLAIYAALTAFFLTLYGAWLLALPLIVFYGTRGF